MRAAERLWTAHAESELRLVERWNYHNELGAQFPIPEIRVTYAASGTLPAACVLQDRRAVIEHAVYWAPAGSLFEASFLVAILNSELARSRIQGLQARGQFGARHFDKVMLTLPIPRFDRTIGLHRELASAAAEAEAIAAAAELPAGTRFRRARKIIREALAEAGIAQRIDALVERLLAD